MPRAKTKANHSTSWPSPSPERWKDGRQVRTLLDDLRLDQDNDLGACQQMLDALASTIGEYRAAITFLRTLPRQAQQLAELKKAAPRIEKAYESLRDLSLLTRQTITNAYIDGKEHDAEESRRIDLAIDCAHSDLAKLSIAIPRAIKNVSSRERRGRHIPTEHILIGKLGTLFDRFDCGEHDDDRERSGARGAFVGHALKFSKIPAPRRLAPLLSQQ